MNCSNFGSHTIKRTLESFVMSVTSKHEKSALWLLRSISSSEIKSSFLSRISFGFPTSIWLAVYETFPSVYSFISWWISSLELRPFTLLPAIRISFPSCFISKSVMLERYSAISRSISVVVEDCKIKVSDKIPHNKSEAISFGMETLFSR